MKTMLLHCVKFNFVSSFVLCADTGLNNGGQRSVEEEEALATLASLSANASQHLEPLECTFTGTEVAHVRQELHYKRKPFSFSFLSRF